LAPWAGITLPEGVPDAEKLAYVQEKLAAGHDGAKKIWQTIGCYLGYGVAQYADFYDLNHVLVLGRCTSGLGGKVILEGALDVFSREFPELGEKINIQMPDEKSRRQPAYRKFDRRFIKCSYIWNQAWYSFQIISQ
jgi:predicted NBD/HSP70 family sugar kinase